jgi:Cupin superfamily protein
MRPTARELPQRGAARSDPIDVYIVQLEGTKHWEIWQTPKVRRAGDDKDSFPPCPIPFSTCHFSRATCSMSRTTPRTAPPPPPREAYPCT